jgi:5-formyltetrahydrofolate cyclo-ligase
MENPSRIACDAIPSVAETTQTKADLRRALLEKRRAIPRETKECHDAAINAAVLAWCAKRSPQTMGVYWPIHGEPDLRPAYDELASRGIRLALPVVVRKNAPLIFAAWKPGDDLIVGTMGVSAPRPDAEQIHPETILAPCVGFDRRRFRIGYGGGFYDRTLAVAPHPAAIGIAYASALTNFDADEYDIALDGIITEAGCDIGLDEVTKR